MMKKIFLIIMTFVGPNAYSEPIPELVQEIKKQVEILDREMERSQLELDSNRDSSPQVETPVNSIRADEAHSANASWLLRTFFLRFLARVDFALPGIIKVRIAPTFELVWQRTLPEGWSRYIPISKGDGG